MMSKRIEISEQASIRRDVKSAFAQLAKAVERRDGIQVQVNQFTPDVVQDREKEFT
jgi:hypothetical protein